MKAGIYILVCLMAVSSCSRGKYYITDRFRKGDTCSMNVITIDSSYRFYIREVFMTQNEKNEKVIDTGSKLKIDGKKIIEIEYLLLSWQQKKVIYISTIPDKFQHYYSSCFTPDTLLNAYNFSTFHFGNIAADGESIEFVSPEKKQTVTWDIRPFIGTQSSDKISIREIVVQQNDEIRNIVLMSQALEQPLTFIRRPNFSIVFAKPRWKADSCVTEPDAICRMVRQKIYVDNMKKGYDIFFCFDKRINSQDSVIGFDYHRTRSTPGGENSL